MSKDQTACDYCVVPEDVLEKLETLEVVMAHQLSRKYNLLAADGSAKLSCCRPAAAALDFGEYGGRLVVCPGAPGVYVELAGELGR